ncbi:MAG: hypothetical protein EP338_11770 [Bacteroidetes bacterium]|nr:MAG: hypothetical protein EP338_11770 [Bacteroidota bacterium]
MMGIKRILFLGSASLVFLSACAQHLPQEVPYQRDPEVPSLDLLQKEVKQDLSALRSKLVVDDKGMGEYIYSLNGKVYNGWVVQVLPENEHKYRFMHLDSGWVDWQIGYYASGTLDFDFHQKDGFSLGSERMWYQDGKPYVDNFYGGLHQKEGLQSRWYASGQLAYQALYKDQKTVYEVSFDEQGKITERRGELPELWSK